MADLSLMEGVSFEHHYADKQWVQILREAVITTIVTKQQIKNHMGKRSFRALKQFQQACEKIDVMNAERAAVELGFKVDTMVAMKALLRG